MQVITPLFKTYYPKGKKVRLLYSLNNFLIPIDSKVQMNTYYQSRAKSDLFADVTRQARLLPSVPKELYPVQIKITIYRQSNHATDIGNYSVIEKYTTDALVQSGVLAEDNWQYINSVTLVDGGKDSGNPRALYEILKDNQPIDLEPLITPDNNVGNSIDSDINVEDTIDTNS